ncbi:nucleotidyltransferase family protein [Rhizobium gallicum]|uniref:nucleotidyltransferase family protein n=1 Tax=Rhizobium gallicum TaxID=56730 RepID=UPI001EF7A444|nr:nucleotidyltransferase family protein [Rhizobium gallicum]ULJ76105.1 nucleotidyltransferase family protein [Rhizobium gallicum]
MRSGGSESGFQVLAALLNGITTGQDQWDKVVQEANRHLVGPALYGWLRHWGLLISVPGEVEKYLRFLYDLNEERNRRLRRQSVETLRVLNEAGIEPLLIKGSALLMIMPEHRLGNRMISDLDLVIDRNNVERSVGRLRGIGYQPLPEDPGPHAYGKFYRPTDVGSLDLHLRPPGPAILYTEGEPLHSTRLEVMGVRVCIPTPVEWVVHLIVHDMILDRRLRTGDVELRHLLDCREIFDLGYDVDWDAVRARLPSGRLALARDLFFLNLQRLAGVKIDGSPAGLLANLLFSRQIARQDHGAYKNLDDFGLSLLRAIWKPFKIAAANQR